MDERSRTTKENEELSATNKSLNQTLDNMTNSKHPKTYEKYTQTDNIDIKTKKTTYVLKENELYNENNKSIGVVCSN